MTTDIANEDVGRLLGEDWRSALETSVRVRIRGLIEEELAAALGRAPDVGHGERPYAASREDACR